MDGSDVGLVDNDGFKDGSLDGSALLDGDKLSSLLGCEEGNDDGIEEGIDDGSLLGSDDGIEEVSDVGFVDNDGLKEGSIDGSALLEGNKLGSLLG